MFHVAIEIIKNKHMKNFILFIVALFFLNSCSTDNNTKTKETTDSTIVIQNDTLTLIDPLPSWNETSNKQAIINFVNKVCNKDSADFIPVENRITVFDNDGTLWSEKPTYFQIEFVLYRIKQLAPQHKEWKRDKLIKAALKHDIQTIREKFGAEGLNRLMTIAQSGMTIENFNKTVRDWMKNAKHPTTGKSYSQMVFQPMLELINYLKANNFKVYIVSGGGIDFMRVWTADYYGIQPENVIGSFARPVYKKVNGKPVLIKTNNIVFINDGKGKPIAIHQVIGKKPVMAFGNSDGDIQMLEWCSSNQYANLSAFVHHTDAKREWAYDKNTHTGKLNKGLNLAKSNNWLLIDMKNDWKTIFPKKKDKSFAQK